MKKVLLPALVLAAFVCALSTGCVLRPQNEVVEGSGSELLEPITDVVDEPTDEPPVRTLENPVIPAGTNITELVPDGLAELINNPSTEGVSLVYEPMGEALETYPVEDPETIRSVLEALAPIKLVQPAELMATDAGERFTFTTADGSSYAVYFELGQLDVNGDFYEVEGAEDLWRLTASLRSI